MSHLEALLKEYYEWQGYLVQCNTLVGRLAKGGWEMELDLVAYQPKTNELIHLEPSLDANTWALRAHRFAKKFTAGKKYILTELFPWLSRETAISQFAILPSAAPHRRMLAGASVRTVDEVIGEIRSAVACRGKASRSAVAEKFPLLRTIQLTVCGYYGVVQVEKPMPAGETVIDKLTHASGLVKTLRKSKR